MSLRQRIYDYCLVGSQFGVFGDVELNEDYFGDKRVGGKHGRGGYGKTIEFGLLKRGGKVYTEIVPNCKSKILQDTTQGKASAESVINTDGWREYDGLVDIGYDHSNNEFAILTRYRKLLELC